MTTRGGLRPGAGRKPKRGEVTDPIVTRIKRSNREWLMAEKERTGLDTGVILDQLIEAHKSQP